MIRLGRPDDPTSTDRAHPTIEIHHKSEKIAPDQVGSFSTQIPDLANPKKENDKGVADQFYH
jgi:hypothetical protein